MKRFKPWLIATIAAALTLSIVASVSAQAPQPPSAFIGTVTSDDGPVAVGVSVEAHVGETLCNTLARNTYADPTTGATKYYVTVHNSSTRAGCGTDGDTITFRIGGRAATQTSAHGLRALETVNLTLAPEVTSVTVDVTVWQSVRTGNIFVSTRPQGADWTTHNTPIDLSNLSSSGNFYQGSPVTVAVDLGGGRSVNIDVTVWRSVRTGNHFVSTRPEGADWTTFNTPIDLSNLSSSGNFYQGTAVTAEVELQ